MYETDFYGWTQRQAEAMRSGDLAGLDLENLIEEIESMGKREKRELESRLEVLLAHLLKWRYQPGFRGASRQATIKEQRGRIADHMRENPSLKGLLPETYGKTYRYSVLKAVRETGMAESAFPPQCPWTFEQAVDPGFWPA